MQGDRGGRVDARREAAGRHCAGGQTLDEHHPCKTATKPMVDQSELSVGVIGWASAALSVWAWSTERTWLHHASGAGVREAGKELLPSALNEVVLSAYFVRHAPGLLRDGRNTWDDLRQAATHKH